MVGGDHVVTFGSASILRAEYVVDGPLGRYRGTGGSRPMSIGPDARP